MPTPVQPASKRLVTEAALADPTTPAGASIDSKITAKVAAKVTTEVAAQDIPGKVAAQVAAAPTVTAAAASAAGPAVDAKVAAAGLLGGARTGGTLDDETFTITDVNDRKSWLAIAPDGGPPARVQAIIQAIAQSGLGFTVSKAEGLGRAWNIVDTDGREALWIDETGALGFYKLGSLTLTRLIAALQAAGFNVIPTSYQDAKGVTHQTASGLNVICWGDSLTAGAGAATIPAGGTFTTSSTYPQKIQTLLDARLGAGKATVYNAGVGGETSVTIAARANATPLVLLPRTAIPSSGAVDVDLQALNGAATTPLLQGNGGGVTGNLWVNGVPIPGSISLVQPGGGSATFNSSTDYYRFTRSDTGGAAITTIRPYRFTYDFADAHRDDIHIISIGQNGPAHPRPLYDAQAIIQRMSALDKRFLVVNKPSSTDAEDAAYHDAFGRRYFPLRKYLVAYGLADAGLSATAQDNTDIAAGTVPTSLRIDAVHGNAAYYHIWGQQLFNRLVELGWV